MSWLRLYDKLRWSAEPQLRHFVCPLADCPDGPCPTSLRAEYYIPRCRTHELVMREIPSEVYWRLARRGFQAIRLCEDASCRLARIPATYRVRWVIRIGPSHEETVKAFVCDDHLQAKQFGQTGVIVSAWFEALEG
jgi:hypothetical protein